MKSFLTHNSFIILKSINQLPFYPLNQIPTFREKKTVQKLIFLLIVYIYSLKKKRQCFKSTNTSSSKVKTNNYNFGHSFLTISNFTYKVVFFSMHTPCTKETYSCYICVEINALVMLCSCSFLLIRSAKKYCKQAKG